MLLFLSPVELTDVRLCVVMILDSFFPHNLHGKMRVFICALLFITFITSDRVCFILIASIDSVPMMVKQNR